MEPVNLHPTEIPVLSYLMEEHFVTGRQLGRQLGLSRVSVWKQIQRLKKMGYRISSDSRKGYQIIARPDLLLPAEIERNLNTEYVGKQIFHYHSIPSTNRVAKERVRDNQNKKLPLQEGAVFIAEVQTAGRGRMGRVWHSPFGGIWLTIILFPHLEPVYLQRITLMTAVALVRTIRMLYEIEVKIKWPNDLMVDGRKIGGILTEMSAGPDQIHYLLIGIGINANLKKEDLPKEFRKQATSLQEILGKEISRIQFVQVLLENFEKYYDQLDKKQFEPILNDWKRNSETLQRKITIESAGQTITGEAIDITPEGALVVREQNGKIDHIISGTVY